MRQVDFVAPRVPFVDVKTGIITREWYLLLEQLFSWKMGEAETDAALSIVAVDGGSEVRLLASMQELRQSPIGGMPADVGASLEPPQPGYIAPDDVAPILGLLRDEIAELRKMIEGLGVAP